MSEHPRAKQLFRILKWVFSIVAVICALLWLGWGVHRYWNDVKLVNFLAAWIPFVLSILLAFIPDSQMSKKKRILWRTCVIGAGLAWSIVLWHQQVIADMATKQDQAKIVSDAVTKSNEHSDQQIAGVRTDVQTETKALNDKLTSLSEQVKSVNGNVSRAIPLPPQYAKLQFSLYSGPTTMLPITTKSLSPDKDGVFNVDFVVTNISETSGKSVELWVYICDDCAFAEEPKGFDKPLGSKEQTRHKSFPILNPGATSRP